jgi:hypothetical protein
VVTEVHGDDEVTVDITLRITCAVQELEEVAEWRKQ